VAVLVAGLLSAWVITGGAGTITRIWIQIGLAAVVMRAYAASHAIHGAPTYLTIRNLSRELSADVVLLDPARDETDITVPLSLTFRQAGQIHVDASVTAPGSPGRADVTPAGTGQHQPPPGGCPVKAGRATR
jgi:hypothetical protein